MVPKIRYIFLSILITLITSVPLFAQNGEGDSRAQEIYGQVMSPFCPGRLLTDCPTSEASALKNKIRDDLSAGKSEDEILSELFLKYGDRVRAAPKNEGFGRVAWAAPLFFLFLGLFAYLTWSSRGRRESSLEPPLAASTLNPELQKRIERDL